MRISRITRIDITLALDARLANGVPVSVSTIGVALMHPHISPNEATVWTSTAYSAGTATITVCGEDAGNTTGALIVPDTGADLWVKVDTGTEVEVAKIERIAVYDSEDIAEIVGHDGTITIGAVAALPAGSDPTVTNTGDEKNVQLAFGIPVPTLVDGSWNNGPLRLGAYYLWVDATGDLRIKDSAPSSATDGVVVGTQS